MALSLGLRNALFARLSLACLLGSLAVAAGLAPAAAAGSYYVDKTAGSCSNTGPGSVTVPFCSVAKGMSWLQPGDTLFIGDGTYAETIQFARSGTSVAPITVTRWPGTDPVISGRDSFGAYISSRSYLTLSDLTFANTDDDGIYVTKSTRITISGNTITGAGTPASGLVARGIVVKSTSNAIVTRNVANYNSDAGIYITTGTTSAMVSYNEANFNAREYSRSANGIYVNEAGNTILGNVTHDNEDSGIYFSSGGNNNLVTLNLTYNNGDHGIDNFSVTGGRIIGNTVYRNCTSGINVEGTSSNFTIKNNIAVDNAVYPAYQGMSCTRRDGNIGVYDSAPSTTVVDSNLVWLSTPGTMYFFAEPYTSLADMQAATTQEAYGLQANPKFANPGTRNLQLIAGSPAIDRADSGAGGQQLTDILGNARVDDPSISNAFAHGPRKYDDMGAYEFQPDPDNPNLPPTAALTLNPPTGTYPVQVTADGSNSTDPEGQSLVYTFNFGDGTIVGPQSEPVATHTYTSDRTFSVIVTVTDPGNLGDDEQQNILIDAPPGQVAPTYVNQIATNYSTLTKTTGYVTVWRTQGVAESNLVVVTLQLSGSGVGPVSASDDAGTVYSVASDVSDGTGNRLVVLSGVSPGPIPTNARIYAAFPSASSYRMTADEFRGVTKVDVRASATGTGTTFSAGPTDVTASQREVIFAAVAIPSGTANPTWATDWKPLSAYVVAGRYLGRAYQLANTAGTFTASGTTTGAWLASVAGFRY